MQRIITLSDWHIPYHDPKAVELAFKMVRDLKPHKIIVHEMCDWYQLSRFVTDPARLNDLQKDINLVREYLKQLKHHAKKAEIIMLHSNHDRRMQKYLWTHAKELSMLEDMTVPERYHLNKMNIPYKAYEFFRKTVLFKHGDKIRQHSAYTARTELEKEGVSGCSGHTHRLGMHFSTKRGGSYVWVENGCLCKDNQEYLEGQIPDWQLGFGIFTFKDEKKHFFPSYAQIIHDEILWGDKLYKL